MSVIAIDLGGTRIKVASIDSDSMRIADRRSIDTPADARSALAAAIELGIDLAAGRELTGVGLCVPGLVDEGGTVVSLPGKLDGIEGMYLRGLIGDAFGAPVLVANDAIAYGAGEATFGAGAGYERCVVITIGTGVGVTATSRGVPVTDGVLGGGLVGGFIPISEVTEGRNDSNGRPDTIEALCAARRIVDYANDAGGDFPDVESVYRAHEADDPAARTGLVRYRTHLARALVALASAHAPGCIVVGGGPLTPSSPLLTGMEELVNGRLFGTYNIALRMAVLGHDAAPVGLAHMLRETT